MNAAKVERDQRLRRAILEVVDAGKAAGEVRGTMLLSAVRTIPEWSDAIEELEVLRPQDKLLQLLGDLVHLGVITERDARTFQSQRRALETLLYGITAKGTALLAGLAPKEPLIADERI